MAKDIFYVKVETTKAATVYAFTRSETGIMDYAGTATPSADELSQMQCVEGSAYFTPSWYTYLPKELQAEITVFIPAAIKDLDANQYSFLLHVGALLLAVQERDSLLTAEVHDDKDLLFAIIPNKGKYIFPVLVHLRIRTVYHSRVFLSEPC